MNRRQLAEWLAKQAHTSRAQAADQVDTLVYGILKEMKDNAKQTGEVATSAPKPPVDPASASKTPAKRKK